MKYIRKIAFIKLFLVAACLGCIGFFVNYKIGMADPGGSDRGLTILAGSTAIAKGDKYPVIQRPPLYSAFLSIIGFTQGVATDVTTPAAREFGNNNRLMVAQGYLEPSFLRSVLLIQTFLFFATCFVFWKILRLCGLSSIWCATGLFTFIIIPNSWQGAGSVYDAIFTQFLISLGLYAFVAYFYNKRQIFFLIGSAVLLSLAGLSHAVFQLLVPAIIILCTVYLLVTKDQAFIPMLLVFALCWSVIVGSWMIRNYIYEGFLGVSGVTGATTGTKTSLFLERAQDNYPDETPVFTRFRNETFLSSSENSSVLWGGLATQWLMKEKGMTYVEANKFLFRFNLTAIKNAPLRYLLNVSQSCITFLWTGTGESIGVLKFPLILVEMGLTVVFLTIIFLWSAFHALPRITCASRTIWLPLDFIILLSITLFLYTALVVCLFDVGKSEQRAAVQFLIPLITTLVLYRLRKSRKLDLSTVIFAG